MSSDHSQNHYEPNASFDGYDSYLASAGILIESLRQQLAEARGLLGSSSEWIRFGSTQERYLYAKIQKFILDNQ